MIYLKALIFNVIRVFYFLDSTSASVNRITYRIETN